MYIPLSPLFVYRPDQSKFTWVCALPHINEAVSNSKQKFVIAIPINEQMYAYHDIDYHEKKTLS